MSRSPDVTHHPEHAPEHAAPRAARTAPARRPGLARWHPWLTGGLLAGAVVLLVVWLVGFSLSDRLRREAETRMNAALVGYRVSIGSLSLNVLGLGLDLGDVVVVQEAHPDPPVARLARFGASIQWSALLAGEVVGDLVLDEPQIFLDSTQFRKEAGDERDLEDRGWQEAVRRIYPLEINAFRVNDGRLSYDDGGEVGPVRLTEVDLVARNIRNVASRGGELPSPVELDAVVFGSGRIRFDGTADFLAEPHAALDGRLELSEVPLEPITPVAKHYAVRLAGGTLSADGRIAFAPDARRVELEEVVIDGVQADFVREGAAGARGERAAGKAARGATDPSPEPETAVRVARLRLTNGELGYVDREADPGYRLFVGHLDVTVEDFSNEKGAGTGRAEVKGAFMGSGTASLRATFQPTDARTEFSSSLRIEQVDMRTLNDLLRARGGFDVVAGNFSLYSEVGVREGRIEGYVKPLFSDLDVYDARQDAEEGVLQKAYEGIVGGVGTLLQNRPRDEVATRTDLSGPIESPDTSVWDIVGNLIRNAFFDAILPGLERRAGG